MRSSVRAAIICIAILFSATAHGQWKEQSHGLYGGFVSSFAANGSRIFAGTDSDGGVFISDDGGATWSRSNNGLPPTLQVTAIAVGPSAVFAAVNRFVYKSVDNGASWNLIYTLPNNLFAFSRCLVVSGQYIYLGTTAGGVYSSSDGGATWTEYNTGLTGTFIISMYANGSDIWVTPQDSNYPFRTTNGLGHWDEIITPLPHVRSICALGGTIYANASGWLYKSDNNGSTWSQLNSGQNLHYEGLTVHEGKLFAHNEEDLIVSTDGGNTWSIVNHGLPTRTGLGTLFSYNGTIYASVLPGGICISNDDGATWNISNTGLNNVAYARFCVSGNKVFAATANGIFVSTDNGTNWTLASAITNARLYSDGTTIFAATDRNGSEGPSDVFSSTDGGVTWSLIGELPIGTGSTTIVSNFSSMGSTLYVGMIPYGIFKSNDHGANWLDVSSGLPNTNVSTTLVYGSKIFIANDRPPNSNLYVSDDGGNTWNVSLADQYVVALASHGSTLYAATFNKGVYISTDAGATWTTNGPCCVPLSMVITDSGDIILATNSGGVRLSRDNGKTWLDVSQGLPSNAFVIDIVISGDQVLISGPNGEAVWSRPLIELLRTPQTITFGALAATTFGTAPITLTATASSGLPVSYASSDTNVATVSGNTVTIVGVGSVTITANQAGDLIYASAPVVSQTLVVGKGTQTITLNIASPVAASTTSIVLPATSSAGLPVSYTTSNPAVATLSGNTLTIVSPGITNISATQPGDANYLPASASATVVVNKAEQQITFDALQTATISMSAITLAANSSSGLPITYTSSNSEVATVDGNMLTIVNYGTTTITASQSGDGRFNPATDVKQILDIERDRVEVFNVVTPNNDGAHDFLKILYVEEYTNTVYLYDRWGNEVFEMNGYDNNESQKRFEGNSNVSGTKALNEGTYFYVIDLRLSKKVTGFIELMR